MHAGRVGLLIGHCGHLELHAVRRLEHGELLCVGVCCEVRLGRSWQSKRVHVSWLERLWASSQGRWLSRRESGGRYWPGDRSAGRRVWEGRWSGRQTRPPPGRRYGRGGEGLRDRRPGGSGRAPGLARSLRRGRRGCHRGGKLPHGWCGPLPEVWGGVDCGPSHGVLETDFRPAAIHGRGGRCKCEERGGGAGSLRN